MQDMQETEVRSLGLGHVDFLELQRDSRVTTGNSGCLLCWPREVQSSIRVVKESWGLLSSDCRASRPPLGLGPEANVPLQGRQGWVCYLFFCYPEHLGMPGSFFPEHSNIRSGSSLFSFSPTVTGIHMFFSQISIKFSEGKNQDFSSGNLHKSKHLIKITK